MPLSEEELRALEQMERALADEDPKLASALRGPARNRYSRGRGLLAVAVFVGGIGLLFAGVMIPQMIVGVIGFVVMLGSAMIALGAFRQPPPDSTARETSTGFGVIDGGKKSRPGRDSSNFMDRMEQRWRKRREGGY
ncbi:DUF3040 domain-containing protein [Nocardioides limicola]|uniref:DUF3040 domain-containing protein n=1 Tax=Nocardioides limicola TaxID=2803368 RepID=UPI00193B1A08|nr:DUF3040 domain-containing protein [Nocardioides sp. DJM-14]